MSEPAGTGTDQPRHRPATEEPERIDRSATDQITQATERIRRLEDEIERLRERYQLGQRKRYRRLGIVLGGIGLITFATGLYLPYATDVLFALGGTGVFSAVLLYFLTPENQVPASAGEHVYTALTNNQLEMITELNLSDSAVYIPTGNQSQPSVSLFVPQHPDFEIPADDDLSTFFIITDNETTRGVSLHPSGSELLRDFVATGSRELPSAPEPLIDSLTDGLLNRYGIVDSVRSTVNPSQGHASVGVKHGAYGPVNRFDNPITSFLASGLAAGLDRPVTTEVTTGSGGYDYVVTCRWSVDH